MDNYKIENFEFSDGSFLTSNDVLARLVSEGTDEGDIIAGTKVAEKIYGYAGNDTIDAGDDVIQKQNNSNYAIESFELGDDTGAIQMLTSEDINKIIQDMSAYAADNGISISSVADVKENPDLMNLVANSLAA